MFYSLANCSIINLAITISVLAAVASYHGLDIRVESGSDDPDNLGHLDHFLVGQVGLICILNYLDVTRISHVL